MSNQVFISYAHDDINFIEELILNMEREELDCEFEFWTDTKLVGGIQWQETIDKEIDNSFCVLVVVTKTSILSPYVTYEWSMALGRRLPVVPLVLEEPANFHPKLKNIQWVRFLNHARPWQDLKHELELTRARYLSTEHAVRASHKLLDEARIQRQKPYNNFDGAIIKLKQALEYTNDDLEMGDIFYELALTYAARKRVLKQIPKANQHEEGSDNTQYNEKNGSKPHIPDERQHDVVGEESNFRSALEATIGKNPNHTACLYELGTLYRKLGDKMTDKTRKNRYYSDSEAKFLAALDIKGDLLDPDHESVWGSVGGVRKRLNHREEAIEAYKEAAEIKRTSYPYNNLGLLYMEAGETAKMRQNFKLVELFAGVKLQSDPGNEWVHNDHFISKVVLGKIAQARDALDVVMIIASDSALNSLVDTLRKISRIEDMPQRVKSFIPKAMSRIQERLGTDNQDKKIIAMTGSTNKTSENAETSEKTEASIQKQNVK